VMLLMGRLVARETGRTGLGLAAMAAMGTTSVIAPSACWYSAGQTLWAGFGILASLWYAHCWRRSRSFAALALTAVSAMLAGWFWTIGHIAGPAAAVYLWLDGRPKWRWGALAPLAGSALAIALGTFLGGHKIDSTVSFHGRTTREAARPVEGFLHTAQAIPENLILGNLGLTTKTTQTQGLTITLILAGVWFLQRFRQGGLRAFNPLECTGAAVVLGSYLVEWTVRGYLPFRLLRTVNMAGIVPWYNTVPQIGAVLFLAGWLAGPRGTESKPALLRPFGPLSRLGALGIFGFLLVMIVLNRPRIDVLWRGSVPELLPVEQKQFPIVTMQSMRATTLLFDRAQWQRRHLRRLDQAQAVASRLGIGRDAVHSAFGRLDMPDLPEVYDAAGLLDLPEHGRPVDPDVVRRALQLYVFKEPEPRPFWLPASEPWPPPPELDWTTRQVDPGD
jgi:hypothetical protein